MEKVSVANATKMMFEKIAAGGMNLKAFKSTGPAAGNVFFDMAEKALGGKAVEPAMNLGHPGMEMFNENVRKGFKGLMGNAPSEGLIDTLSHDPKVFGQPAAAGAVIGGAGGAMTDTSSDSTNVQGNVVHHEGTARDRMSNILGGALLGGAAGAGLRGATLPSSRLSRIAQGAEKVTDQEMAQLMREGKFSQNDINSVLQNAINETSGNKALHQKWYTDGTLPLNIKEEARRGVAKNLARAGAGGGVATPGISDRILNAINPFGNETVSNYNKLVANHKRLGELIGASDDVTKAMAAKSGFGNVNNMSGGLFGGRPSAEAYQNEINTVLNNMMTNAKTKEDVARVQSFAKQLSVSSGKATREVENSIPNQMARGAQEHPYISGAAASLGGLGAAGLPLLMGLGPLAAIPMAALGAAGMGGAVMNSLGKRVRR